MNEQPLKNVLLVSDVDGTLITGRFEMPHRNIEAVRRFTRQGGLFALATGRSHDSAAPYAAQAGVNAPSVILNGAAIYDFHTGRILWQSCLPGGFREQLREIMRRFPDIGVEIFAHGHIRIIRENDWTRRHQANEKLPFLPADIDSLPVGWNKVLFAAENRRLAELQTFCAGLPGEGWFSVFSNTMYYEVLPAGVNKMAAARRLAGLLGVTPGNVLTIGDYYNDADLITGSAFSCVPAGAPEELRRAAGYVACPCAEGAVADFIDRIEKRFDCGPSLSPALT